MIDGRKEGMNEGENTQEMKGENHWKKIPAPQDPSQD